MVLVICSGTILAAQGGVEVANLEYHLSLSDSDRLRLLLKIGQRHSFQSPSLVLALWAGCAVLDICSKNELCEADEPTTFGLAPFWQHNESFWVPFGDLLLTFGDPLEANHVLNPSWKPITLPITF